MGTNSFFSVEVLGIALSVSRVDDGTTPSINVPSTTYNNGKGMIVDSGTTDMYLPRASASAFEHAWRDIAGRSYTAGSAYTYTDEQLLRLPSVHVRMAEGRTVTIVPEAYMEWVGGTTYRPRIYLDENSGGVMGGPFLRGHDVLFDSSTKQIGFARATCLPNNVTGEDGPHGTTPHMARKPTHKIHGGPRR